MILKICQIIPTLDQGGAEKQMALLASHLDPSRFQRHVIVLTRTGPLENMLSDAGVQLHFVGKRLQADPLAFVRLVRLLRKIQPHIMHSWIFAANSYGRAAAWWTRVPVVIAGERCVDQWKSLAHQWVDRLMVKVTDCIATNSPSVVDFYQRRGIPSDLFQVIPNAVCPAESAISREDFFRRLNLPPRRYIIGAIGRLWPQKGYPDLIWAAELLRVVLPDTWFVIFGDGPQLGQLQKLRDRYNAQDIVRFAGHRQDAAELMTGLDLLWNGSRYEGQSNSILEAMAAGIPVIASDIRENRALVVHGKTGYLFPLGNVGELARITCNLLPNAQLRRQLGAQARSHASEKFSLNAMLEAYSKLYEQLASKRTLS